MRFFKRVWVEFTSFFENNEFGEGEVNLTTLSVIFFLGLLVLFGIFFLFYDESRMVYNIPTKIYQGFTKIYHGFTKIYHGFTKIYQGFTKIYQGFTKIYQGFTKIYHGFIESYNKFADSIRISAVGDTKTINDSYKMISCKDCKINAKFGKTEQGEQMLIVNYELSHKNYLWRQMHKIFEKIFEMPVDFGWVQINKVLNSADWSKYTDINLLVKGTGKPSSLEFSVKETDGDTWYYFDKTSFASNDWTEIRMPFEDFVNPKWASHGDGKKDFKNITGIGLTITNFENPVKNRLYLETFDGEIFKLI